MPSQSHRRSRRHNIAFAIVVLSMLATSLAASTSGLAQPLCLGDTIWSKEQEKCVAIESEKPTEELIATTEPASEETPVPTEEAEAIDLDDKSVDDPDALDAKDVSDEMEAEEDGDTTRIGEGVAFINFYSFACPPGFDPRFADEDTLASTCHLWVSGIQYFLSIGGETYTTDPSPVGPGGTYQDSLSPGTVTISQSGTPGFTGPAVVNCGTSSVVADSRNVSFTFNGSGGSFQIELKSGDYWSCATYLEAIPTGAVTAYLRGCPAGYDIYTSEPEELQANCTQQFEGTEFMLLHSTEGNYITYTSTFSRADFSNIAEGTARLRLSVPNGYGIPVVFCRVEGPNGQTIHALDRYDVSNEASVAIDFDDLEWTQCGFYMVPGGLPVDTPGGLAGGQMGPAATPQTSKDPAGIDKVEDLDAVEVADPTPAPTP